MADEVVTIKEEVSTVKEPVTIESMADDFTPEEVEMAKKVGLVKDDKKEETKDGKPAEKKAEQKKPDEKVTSLSEDDYDTFEKVHEIYEHNKELFYSLPRAAKNLYHNGKGLYKRLKEEEERRKKVEDDTGLNKMQDAVARIKLEKISKRLANPENLTVEELQELLDVAQENNDDDKPLTRKDIEAMEAEKGEKSKKEQQAEYERQEAVNAKIKDADEYLKENISSLTGGAYEKSDDIVALAKEVIESKPRYGKMFNDALSGNMEAADIVDVLVDIAKLNTKWGKSEKSEGSGDNKVVEKMVKNAGKQQTSAALSSGKGTRDIHISEDMNPEDALKVWDKIPRDIQRKILLKTH